MIGSSGTFLVYHHTLTGDCEERKSGGREGGRESGGREGEWGKGGREGEWGEGGGRGRVRGEVEWG